jgi:hypothetical protein
VVHPITTFTIITEIEVSFSVVYANIKMVLSIVS